MDLLELLPKDLIQHVLLPLMYHKNRLLEEVIQDGNLVVLEVILEDQSREDCQRALRLATHLDQVPIAHRLVDYFQKKDWLEGALQRTYAKDVCLDEELLFNPFGFKNTSYFDEYLKFSYEEHVPFVIAAKNGNIRLMDLYWQKMKECDQLEAQRALFFAAMGDHLGALKWLLERKIGYLMDDQLDTLLESNRRLETILLLFNSGYRFDDPDRAIKKLLGTRCNEQSKWSNLSKEYAYGGAWLELVTQLIDQKPEHLDLGFNEAVYVDCWPVLELCLVRGVDLLEDKARRLVHIIVGKKCTKYYMPLVKHLCHRPEFQANLEYLVNVAAEYDNEDVLVALMHFSSKIATQFLNKGPKYKIEIKLDHALHLALAKGHIKIVKLVLELMRISAQASRSDALDPYKKESNASRSDACAAVEDREHLAYALCLAASKGSINGIKLLMDHGAKTTHSSQHLCLAALNGDKSTLAYLLVCPFKVEHVGEALKEAAYAYKSILSRVQFKSDTAEDILGMLAEVSQPKDRREAMILALEQKNEKAVKALLKYLEPQDLEPSSEIIQMAIHFNHEPCLKQLKWAIERYSQYY